MSRIIFSKAFSESSLKWMLTSRICKTVVGAPGEEASLKAFAPVQEMMTYVQSANDECDYGMGLKLGMDLLCGGSHYLQLLAGQLLLLGCDLLKRKLCRNC